MIKAYYLEIVFVLNIYTKLKLTTFLIFFLTLTGLHAQESEYDSLLNYYLKSDSILLDQLEFELASDSLDILDLIDSLLYTDFRFSQLSFRLGYTSNITYAGRNFGIEQFGVGIGAAYYHKTGLFADVSGYWNSEIVPNYNPTIFSTGYFGKFTKKWTYILSYDHYFYQTTENEDDFDYYPLTNSLNASTYLELGKLTIAGDYSFLFGQELAHRVRGNLMYTFSKNNWGFIDRFVFMPSASILLGNSDIYLLTPTYRTYDYQTWSDLQQLMYEEYGENRIRQLRRRKRYAAYEELKREIIDKYELTNYYISVDNVFGIMNYSLSAPFYFYIDNFTFALSYHYNIPIALPGENIDLSPNSYAGAMVIYNIPFMKKKKK